MDNPILLAILSIAGGLLNLALIYLIPALKAWRAQAKTAMGADRFNFYWSLAEVAVRAVQQMYPLMNGNQKYNTAVGTMVARLADTGIVVEQEIARVQFKDFIEGALKKVKMEAGEAWKEAPAETPAA